MTNSTNPLPADQADELRLWSDKLDRVADRFTERLDYDRYTGLTEQACELRAVAELLTSPNRVAHVAQLIELAQEHLRSIEQTYGKENRDD